MYAIVESGRVGVTCYSRRDEAGEWTVETFKERGQSVPLAAVGGELPLEAIYERTGL